MRPDAARDAFLVLLDALVALERHATLGQFAYGRLDVVDREVEDRVGRRHMVRLGVDEDVAATRDVQAQQPVLLRHLQSQRLAVELLGSIEIGYGEAAECLAVLEHDVTPFRVLTQAMTRASGRTHRRASSPTRRQLQSQTAGP